MQESFIGIEIGGTKIQIARGDRTGAIAQRQRFAVDGRDGGGIRSLIKETLLAWAAEMPVSGVGVGFGGPVDWETGRVAKSHHVSDWDGFALADWLGNLTGAPAWIENDTNVGALAEAGAGAGRTSRVVFYTNQGTGVGGGLAIDGEIYHGAKPGEAEFGHVLLDRQGTTIEQRCSGRAVDAKVARLVAAEPTSQLARLVGAETRGARFLGPAIEAGDREARALLEETADDLAFGLSHVSQLFHPEVIVLGGGLSLLGEVWRAAVARRLPPYIMDVHQPGPPVKLAGCGEDVVLVGALLLAAKKSRARHPEPALSKPCLYEKMA